MYEVYRIETIAGEGEGGGVIRRILVRAESLDVAKERALRMLARERSPQAKGPKVEAVRVLNGAGFELFQANVRD